ncbi:GNAT family N-acetyltransferase [Hujiaoplasma nucleasis]|uniref:GNAT family N-acetyltransferase n=1 Tax=Hujiaoplasma nucleasis TaxID=2725268 RepID=A0A7L6N5Y9_9MOLU|nr:bifunctional GNAT family N-acetyltransferase/class I SAM-dependent methyltransferase [Hujiaoplasma nucleasis]QLY39989.1 GNAT family N-acetyltransferase [Hujiaoplasma nucleasis]
MFEIWNKQRISNLSQTEIEQWFDVLNQGLEEDRGYDLSEPNIEDIRAGIKTDYIDYLKSCEKNQNFYAYYILRDDDGKIVSVCRIVIVDNQYYLEGLETHRDYYYKGYASKLFNKVMYELKRDNIKTIYSIVRNHNHKSINFHYKNGFRVENKDDLNIQLILNVEDQIRKDLFDNWVTNYNKSVIKSEKEVTYPFAGYSKVKYQIIDMITKKPYARILDMGVGTGEITGPLHDLGYNITGVDLSDKMIDLAKSKMPNAMFICDTFQNSLAKLNNQYDFIIFNYSIHHLDYQNHIDLLLNVYDYLSDHGMIIIGDVSTLNTKDIKQLQEKYDSIWDDEEYYPIVNIYRNSELKKYYKIYYKKINDVTGIFELLKI